MAILGKFIKRAALLLLLFGLSAGATAQAGPQGLGEAPGITWKQAQLAPGWELEVPVYWQEEAELAPGVLGAYSCAEVREFIRLSLVEEPDQLMMEAIRSADPGRTAEILNLYSTWISNAAAERGERVVFKNKSIEWVGNYGAVLLVYSIELSESFSMSFAQYLLPFDEGVYSLSISVDARALDYIAMTLARRTRISDEFGKKGGVHWKEIGKGYPKP